MTTTESIIAEYGQYVMATYGRSPAVFVRGQGSRIWDAEGRRYLDFFPGWGVSNLGHCHPTVVRAIKSQASRLLHLPNNFYNEWQGELAKTIIGKSFPGTCFFCNSGAEANEGAIKLARRFGHPNGRFEIITMLSSFHGRTLAAITATGQPKYQAGFEPLVPGFRYVPFNDREALRAAITPQTAAVMLELVQGEGGVRPASPEFARFVRELCDREKILMIVDEVQTGMGRTGEYFAFQAYGVQPDVMTLAKSLGGGVPIGAMVARGTLGSLLPPGSHASTFGGNPLVCRAGLAAFQAMEEEGMLENARQMGAYLMERLRLWKDEIPLIAEVRGIGLMIGIELVREGKPVVEECLRRGLIVNCTAEKVLRLMPALTITEKEAEKGLQILKRSLKTVSKTKVTSNQ
jgi:acetylornithine/N-succinyldiaminopimelate aminotransferase